MVRERGGESLHLLTVEDYERMAEAGILREDDAVELLDGLVVDVSPEGPAHRVVTSRLLRWAVVGVNSDETLEVAAGSPLALRPRSMPEPDLAVIRRADRDFTRHPDKAMLVIEVSRTSLRIDRSRKASIYARARVPEYWIVNLVERRIEVHRLPDGDGYRSREDHRPPTSVIPSAVELPALELEALFDPGPA